MLFVTAYVVQHVVYGDPDIEEELELHVVLQTHSGKTLDKREFPLNEMSDLIQIPKDYAVPNRFDVKYDSDGNIIPFAQRRYTRTRKFNMDVCETFAHDSFAEDETTFEDILEAILWN